MSEPTSQGAEHLQKSVKVAEMVATMASGALSNLDVIMRDWPSEFQAIMWDAVVFTASQRAADARMKAAASKRATEQR